MMRKFYVYAYYEERVYLEGGLPFYIGKGCRRRAYEHLAKCKVQTTDVYNTIFYKKLRKMLLQDNRPKIVIVVDKLINEEAIALEIELIRLIGRRKTGTGPLCNLTDGGDGTSGYKLSDETKKKIGDKHRGKLLSPEHRKHIGDVNRGKVLSEETKRRIGEAHKGKFVSEETRARMSQSLTGRYIDEKWRKNMSLGHSRRPVCSFNVQGNLVNSYESITQACDGGYTRCCISACLAGRQKTHKGLTWRYTDA